MCLGTYGVPLGVGVSYQRGTPVQSALAVVDHANVQNYKGTSPIRKRPPLYDPPMTLGIGLL